MKGLRADRLASLDALRGFAIAAMVLVNNPGDWDALYAPLAHARWHGWTFTDWVFPFFLFAVGVSMSFSLAARAAAGASRARLLAVMARRSALIFAIGLALNAVPAFDWAQLRVPGVLQRIALASLLAAPLVLWCRWRGLLLGALAWCALYAWPMLAWPVPDAQRVVGAGVLEPGRDFGAWIDRQVFGAHLWKASRSWDPEGLWSTLPAVATVLLGAIAGRGLASAAAPAEKTAWLFVAGLGAAWLGTVLDAWFMPINKNLWTPSYTVFTAGWAACALGVFHWLMDAAPQPGLRAAARRGLQPLVVYGVNALAVFVVSGLLARLLLVFKLSDGRSLKQALYAPLQALPLAPPQASLLYALGFQLAMFALAWVLWRRRWFFSA
ncbi:MAG: heparan-alpha-glucosaminide N-acetyltransferase domain-containing protein [Rubrivivax sp.]